jgi:hypothetical protein
MSSYKLRARKSISAACFGRGDAFSRKFISWLPPRGGGSGLCAPGGCRRHCKVATAEIAENINIDVQISAVAAPRAAKAPGACTGHHHYPRGGVQSPNAVHKHTQAVKMRLCLKGKDL